jgi:hypothetical protein
MAPRFIATELRRTTGRFAAISTFWSDRKLILLFFAESLWQLVQMHQAGQFLDPTLSCNAKEHDLNDAVLWVADLKLPLKS